MSNNIILNPHDQATCPHCEKQFELHEALSHQLIDRYESEYSAMLNKERKSLMASIEKETEKKQARIYAHQLED